MTARPMYLTILGGYLGAGKTTWLRHQLHQGAFGPVHVLVNEAAEIPVDDALLRRADRLTVLAGGCACCAGLHDLITTLRAICEDRSGTGSAAPDQLVLETSGLADPEKLALAIRSDPVLVRHLILRQIIAVVDGLHGLDQLRTEALARRQIEAADTLVITKADAADPTEMASLMATLRGLNPVAECIGASHGTPFALPEPAACPIALPPLDREDHPLLPTQLALRGEDWPAFTVWLSALLHARGEDIVRVKGVVRTPAGRLLLQAVRRVVQPPEILPDADGTGDDALVVIGRGYPPDALQASLNHFLR